MIDQALIQRSPLAGSLKPGRRGDRSGEAGVCIAERTGLALASIAALRGREAAVSAALEAAFGLTAPTRPCRVQGDRLALSWTGPQGQWLADSDAALGDLAAALRERLGPLAAVTDQSDGWLVCRLTGPRVRDMLAKCLTIDLDPRCFQPGDIALTRAGHLDVRLWHLREPGTYEISCFRSYGASLFGWLEESALAFGLEILGPA